jgi:ribosomal protein S18 acetylase RimI-like enzyme
MQTLSGLEADIGEQVLLKATSASDPTTRIVGSVRARLDEEACLIGRLIVHPDAQGQGLGTQLMAAMEASFPEVQRFEVFTGHLSARILALYKRVGYRETRRDPVSPELTVVLLGKLVGRDPAQPF